MNIPDRTFVRILPMRSCHVVALLPFNETCVSQVSGTFKRILTPAFSWRSKTRLVSLSGHWYFEREIECLILSVMAILLALNDFLFNNQSCLPKKWFILIYARNITGRLFNMPYIDVDHHLTWMDDKMDVERQALKFITLFWFNLFPW